MFWKNNANNENNSSKKKDLNGLNQDLIDIRSEIKILLTKSEIKLRDSTWRSNNAILSDVSRVNLIRNNIPELKTKINDVSNEIKKLPDDIDWSTLITGLAVVAGIVGSFLVAANSTSVKSYKRKDGTRVKGHSRKTNDAAKFGSAMAGGSAYTLSNMDWSEVDKNDKKEDKELSPKEKTLLRCEQLLKLLEILELQCRENIQEAQKYLSDPISYQKNYQFNQVVKIAFFLVVAIFILVGILSSIF